MSYLPHSAKGRRADTETVYKRSNADLSIRGVSKLHFVGVCDSVDARHRHKRSAQINLDHFIKDELLVKDSRSGPLTAPVFEFENGPEARTSADAPQLINCITEEAPIAKRSQCLLNLVKIIRADDSNARRVVDLICRGNDLPSQWRYLIQALAASLYGQECIVRAMRNNSIATTPERFSDLIVATHGVDVPHPRLVSQLKHVTTRADYLDMQSRHAAALSLGRLARKARERGDNILAVDIVSHLERRLSACPVRDEREMWSQFDDHVIAHAAALGNAGHDKSLVRLLELVEHNRTSIRRAAVYGMRHMTWAKVEPVFVRIVSDRNRSEAEKLAAVDAMLSRRDELTENGVKALSRLYHNSVHVYPDVEKHLLLFFKTRTDEESRATLKKGLLLRSVRDAKETHLSRARRKADIDIEEILEKLLNPLVDKAYGVDKTFSKDFGADKVKASFVAVFRNLVRIYLSIFDAKVELDIFNDVNAFVDVFGFRFDIIHGRAAFQTGLSYKNEFLSKLLNAVVGTAEKVLGNIRNSIAPFVEFVITVLDFLDDTFLSVDVILKPVLPFLNLMHSAMDLLDKAVAASNVVLDFIKKIKSFISRVGGLTFLRDIVRDLLEFLKAFAEKKLAKLSELCSNLTINVVDPINLLGSYIENVTDTVNHVKKAVDGISETNSTKFGKWICDLAGSLSNFDFSVNFDGPSLRFSLEKWLLNIRGFALDFPDFPDVTLPNFDFPKLPGVQGINLPGLPSWDFNLPSITLPKIIDLSNFFTGFIDWGGLVFDGFKFGFKFGKRASKKLVLDFKVNVISFKDILTNSRSVIDEFHSQLERFSAVSDATKFILALGKKSLLDPSIVGRALVPISVGIRAVEKQLCGTTQSLLSLVRGHADFALLFSQNFVANMTEKVQGFLRNASDELFEEFVVKGRQLSAIDLFQIVQNLMKESIEKVATLIDDEVITKFNSFARDFNRSVSDFIDTKIEEFAEVIEEKLAPFREYLETGKDFVRFVKMARDVSELVGVLGSKVPEIVEVSERINEILDRTLEVSGWIQSVVEFVTDSKNFVNYAKQGRDFVLNLIDDGVENVNSFLDSMRDKLLTVLKKASEVALQYLSKGIEFVNDFIDRIASAVDQVNGFIDSLGTIKDAAKNVSLTFDLTCSFSGVVDIVLMYEAKLTGMLNCYNDLVNATTDTAAKGLLEVTEAAVTPVKNLAKKISKFLEDLCSLVDKYFDDLENSVAQECSGNLVCLGELIADDLKPLIDDAVEIVEDIKEIASLSDVVDKVEQYVDRLHVLARYAIDNVTDVIEFSRNASVADAVALGKRVVDALLSGFDFEADVSLPSFGRRRREVEVHQSISKAGRVRREISLSGFPLVQWLKSLVQKLFDVWNKASDFLSNALDNVLEKVKDFGKNFLRKLCDFFSSLSFPEEIFQPVMDVVDKAEKLAKKLQVLLKEEFFPPLEIAVRVVLDLQSFIFDIKVFINCKIIGTVEKAVTWLTIYPPKYLKKVRQVINLLLLVDAGLEVGEPVQKRS